MTAFLIALAQRALGYAAVGAAGAVGAKTGDELGQWVGAGIGILGGMVLHKATTTWLPKLNKNVLPAGPDKGR